MQHSPRVRASVRLRRLSVQLADETLRSLAREAERASTSVSRMAREAIARGLQEIRRTELERQLRNGYEGLAEEHRKLAREMDSIRSLGD
jgi:predicted transcriptional regulator